MQNGLTNVVLDIAAEVERAEGMHAVLNSHHEAYAVILEELDEYKRVVWLKSSQRDVAEMRTELVQTAAMCVRAIRDLIDGRDAGTESRKLLQDMTEPELANHLNTILRFIRSKETADTIGSMLVIFGNNGVSQYGATVDPETAPQALRELADRIERRQTVLRTPEEQAAWKRAGL